MRLVEFTPSRTQFSRILADESLRMGFECEVLLPEESDSGENEIDWDSHHEMVDRMSWSDIEHTLSSRREERILDKFQDWRSDKLNEEWDEVAPEEIKAYLENHGEESDPDDEETIEAAKENWVDRNGSYDMDDFISEEYGSMSRFCSVFDIDIEPDESTIQYSNDTAYVHGNAASDLSHAIGAEVLVGDRGAEDWHVEEDSSIKGDGTGMEIISPVFGISDGLTALDKVFDWIKSSASTNTSTGLHVSFSIEGKAALDYDYLKMIILFDENYTAKIFNRLSNTFAVQMRSTVFTNLNDMTSVSQMSERSIQAAVAKLRGLSPHVHSIASKYFSFRHRSNGVFEFRSMGGKDYEDRFDTIRKRIVAMAAVMKVGADPNMMAREYLSRVYRMLTSEKFSSSESIPKVVMPAILSSFTGLPRNLIEMANDNPRNFLAWLAIEIKTPLQPMQIRQLRVFARKNGLRSDMYDGLRRTNMARYNMLANYMRWPIVMPDEPDELTDPRQKPFSFAQVPEHK